MNGKKRKKERKKKRADGRANRWMGGQLAGTGGLPYDKTLLSKTLESFNGAGESFFNDLSDYRRPFP